MRKKYGIYLMALVAVCIISVIVYSQASKKAVWDETTAENFAESYFDTMIEKGPESGVSNCYFTNEVEREMYLGSDFPYTDYEIQEIAPINENLYALTVELSGPSEDGTGEEKLTAYNFVAQIDGKTYFMNNERHVPQSVEEGLDRSKYKTEGKDGLGFDDIVTDGDGFAVFQ